MKRNRAAWMLAVLSSAVLAASCGGGGNRILEPPTPALVAVFTADAPSADPRTSMEPGASTDAVFSIEIHANAITDLYGAAFTLLYNPAEATYLGCEAQGSILSSNPGLSNDCDDTLVGGAKFATALENGIPGFLNVRASKDGLVPGVPNGTGLLLTLTFEATGEIPPPGEPYVFEAGASREIQVCPQDLSPCSVLSANWDGGTLVATLI